MTSVHGDEVSSPTLWQQIWRRKPVTAMTEETGTDTGEGELARTIGLFQLSLFGIGATIGTGIFIVLTVAVPEAGPAVIISFVVAGVVAGLTAICYAELAGAVPVSGSSYSYAYATLGEGIAMIVAACLLLEYGVSAAAVAVGWSQYLNELLDNLFGFTIPDNFSNAPEADGIINLPAILLVGLCTLLLIRGASESAKVNAIMVLIKLGVLVLFILVGVTGWDSDNLSDFAPFGLGGVMTGASIIFFSYIGLDAVSTAGEEVKNPRRNLPLAILIALVVVTSIYVLVAIVAVAAQPAADFEGQEAGLAAILEDVTGATWPSTLLAAGAVISIFSVTLVVIYGQTRILFAMGRDGMVPRVLPPPEPAHADAGAGHDRRGGRGLAAGRAAADQLPGRDDQHRDADRVPDRVDRRDGPAAHGARPAARLQGAALPGAPDPLDRRLHLDHHLPAGGDDLRVLRLVGGRAALVLLLQPPPLEAGEERHDPARGATRPTGTAGRSCTWRPCSRARRATTCCSCAVVPVSWPPSPARVDAEYQAELQRAAEDALEAARGRLPDDIPVATVVHHARSTPAGLLELAEQHDGEPDRRRLVAVRRARVGDARQRDEPAAAQLADPGRARAARLPRGVPARA